MEKTTNHLLDIIQAVQACPNKSIDYNLEMLTPFLNENITPHIVKATHPITTVYTPTNKVYYVVTGSLSMIRTSRDGKNTIRNQKTPRFLGVDYAVLSYRDYYPDIIALEDCLVLEINQDYFLESIQNNSTLCFEVLHEICQRFFRSSFRYDETLFFDPVTKLVIYIVNQWVAHSVQKPSYIIAVPNNRIAEEIGVSPRTFYRALNKLKEQKLVTVISGNISVTREQIAQMQINFHLFDEASYRAIL